MKRSDLINELADEISCGDKFGEYDAGFFLESLIDASRVTPLDVAVLLTKSEHADAHIETADRLREMVKQAAIEFFTNGRGTDYIDDRLAEIRAEEEADQKYLAKHGEYA